ncbi:hypothetical protein VTK56DRAFT_5556 [Thermocarpiscus australiensis]
MPSPFPTPANAPFIWQRPVCNCYYFYQFYLCGCPDRTVSRGSERSRHIPSFQGCDLYYKPKWEVDMQERYGFRHNANPAIINEIRILPFACYHHLIESRVYLPVAALQKTRRPLNDPKWNPVSAARANKNRHVIQRLREEGCCWESRKRWREEDQADYPQRRRKRRCVVESDELAELRRKLEALLAEAGGSTPFGSGAESPLSSSGAASPLSSSSASSGPPSPPSSASSPASISPPTSVSSPAQTSSRLNTLFPESHFPSPSDSPGAVDSAYEESDGSHAAGANVHPRSFRPRSTSSLSPFSASLPSASPPTSASKAPQPSSWPGTASKNIQTNPLSATTASSFPPSSHPSSIPPSPPRHHSTSTSYFFTPDSSPTKTTTTNHFSSLTWLLEEQEVDLSTLDGFTVNNNSCDTPYPPRYDTYTNTEYHCGAYKIDPEVLNQARTANWWSADPGGGWRGSWGSFLGRERVWGGGMAGC